MFHRNLQTQKSRFFFTFILILIAGILLPACQSAAPATPEPTIQKSPIVIGTSLPLTGARAEAGAATKQGYEVWAALVNESGGLLGRQITLQIVDNASDQDTVAKDYETLITQSKVDLVLGSQSSFLTIPSSKVASDHGYAFVEPAGGSPAVFNRGLKNVFFAQPAVASRQADPFALYLLGLPADQRPKTFAIVTSDDPFSVSVMDRLGALLTDGGIQLVQRLSYPQNQTDFTDIATEIAGLNPDLIIGGTQYQDSIDQIKAYQAAKYQPRFAYFTSGPSVSAPFRQALGSATEGIFSSGAWFPESKEFQNTAFTAKYIALYGGTLNDISEDAANGFTAGQVLQQAVENIKSIDNTALITELHRGTYKTVVGPLNFDDTGAPQGSFMLLQWKGDNFLVVGPLDRAEANPLAAPKQQW